MSVTTIYLRNKFNFWNFHGIMNTWGLLQSIFHLRIKKVLYLKHNRINRFVGSVKQKSGTASLNTDSQWSKQ